jgi:hypothetical protein
VSPPIKDAAVVRNIPQENRGLPNASQHRRTPVTETCIARGKSRSAYILFSKRFLFNQVAPLARKTDIGVPVTTHERVGRSMR